MTVFMNLDTLPAGKAMFTIAVTADALPAAEAAP